MRRRFVAGNWKMNGSLEANAALLEGVLSGVQDVSEVEMAVFPSFVYLPQVQSLLSGTKVGFGAQNMSQYDHGAYTGEVSGAMLKGIGCQYVLVGHSERRVIFGEDDDVVTEKFMAALDHGLTPVLCIGETQEEREAGETEAVVLRQLNTVLDEAGIETLSKAVIAYEPVWAIGTGLTATPEQAQEVHAFIRKIIALQDEAIANGVRIVYGGSVKPANAAEIFEMPDVDGGLIGGASLKAQDFIEIVKA